jgi:outer membrane protein TolC
MIRRLGALLLLSALAACAVGPDYRAPDLTPAAAFRNADSAATAPRPAADWWRGFNDPVLDALEAKALAQNLDLAQAVARVKQARAGASIPGGIQRRLRPRPGLPARRIPL